MSAKNTLRCNKMDILDILGGDYSLILNKVYEKKLITHRDYNNLKSINRENTEGHITALVDKIMNKGEKTCKGFLDLLQTDEGIVETFPGLEGLRLKDTCHLPAPVQASSSNSSVGSSVDSKRQKMDEAYELNSQPKGLCVIINNKFLDKVRNGTDKDAQSLAEVFSWLGFRVLMCKDQTQDQMDRTLKCFATLSNNSQLQEFNVKEWFGCDFFDLQETPVKHGDAFICCVLSHGAKGVVYGIDWKPLPIKQITRTFKATIQSALTSKPKVFLIQACQGKDEHPGVLLPDVEADNSDPLSIPEEADILIALATVEDHVSYRHKIDGSWFIQSLCQQLKEGCLRKEDIKTILDRVNNEVSQKEACATPGKRKQMSEVRYTTTKALILSPPGI